MRVLVAEPVMTVSLDISTVRFGLIQGRIETFFVTSCRFVVIGCCLATVDWESLYVVVLCIAHVNEP